MRIEDDEELVIQRQRIDRVDRTIVALLHERVRLGVEVGRLKRQQRQPVRAVERERDVLTAVRSAARQPLTADGAERIFSVIIEETAAAQGESHD